MRGPLLVLGIILSSTLVLHDVILHSLHEGLTEHLDLSDRTVLFTSVSRVYFYFNLPRPHSFKFKLLPSFSIFSFKLSKWNPVIFREIDCSVHSEVLNSG